MLIISYNQLWTLLARLITETNLQTVNNNNSSLKITRYLPQIFTLETQVAFSQLKLILGTPIMKLKCSM